MNWRLSAACSSADPEAFFANNRNYLDIARAKATCAGCPVRMECLDEGMSDVEGLQGIWGGLTQNERHTMKRLTLSASAA